MRATWDGAASDGDPGAGDDKRFEKAIAQAEAHNTRRALATLAQHEQIPRNERTRQAMRDKACVQVPDSEQLETMREAERLLSALPHKPITNRGAKQALSRLALRGTRAPGPAGGRSNVLVAMGARRPALDEHGHRALRPGTEEAATLRMAA